MTQIPQLLQGSRKMDVRDKTRARGQENNQREKLSCWWRAGKTAWPRMASGAQWSELGSGHEVCVCGGQDRRVKSDVGICSHDGPLWRRIGRSRFRDTRKNTWLQLLLFLKLCRSELQSGKIVTPGDIWFLYYGGGDCWLLLNIVWSSGLLRNKKLCDPQMSRRLTSACTQLGVICVAAGSEPQSRPHSRLGHAVSVPAMLLGDQEQNNSILGK